MTTPLPASVRLGTFADIPAWLIETAHARAAVSCWGGQLLSWVPAGHAEVLWLSPLAVAEPKAIRGGVPVCWPYFGRQDQPADVPQHGHARISPWQLHAAAQHDDGSVELQLALPAHPSTPLRLQQRLRIGTTLEHALVTTHAGDAPVRFSQALHSYFRVGDAMQLRLAGLDGCDYDDKIRGGVHRQHGDWRLDDPEMAGACDRIYRARGDHYTLHDTPGQRQLHIQTHGSGSLVVWNPGADGARAMADLPDAGWQAFVCVEVANAGDDAVTLAPGQSHVLEQRLHVSAS